MQLTDKMFNLPCMPTSNKFNLRLNIKFVLKDSYHILLHVLINMKY